MCALHLAYLRSKEAASVGVVHLSGEGSKASVEGWAEQAGRVWGEGSA